MSLVFSSILSSFWGIKEDKVLILKFAIYFNSMVISLQDLLPFLVSMKHCQFLSDECFCRTCSLFYLPCFYPFEDWLKKSNLLCPHSIGFEFLLLQFPHFSETCHPVLLVIYYSAHWDLVKWPRPNWLSLGKLQKQYIDKLKKFLAKMRMLQLLKECFIEKKSNPLCPYLIGFESQSIEQ